MVYLLLIHYRTMDDAVNQHLRDDREHGSQRVLICRDGLAMRIGAGEQSFCMPRGSTGPYREVEVAFERGFDIELLPYAESSETFPDCVLMYVPVEHLSRVIARHGGLRSPPGEAHEHTLKPMRA